TTPPLSQLFPYTTLFRSGPSVKLSPSMPVPSCGPVVFVHGIPLTPAQVPGFASRLSHCASVVGELCRNTAFFALVFQAAVTFPDALVSKVQGVPETKSPSTTWFVESARNEMPAESAAKLESKLPFAANWPGRSHERFWAFQGCVALPLSRSTPCSSRPTLVPIVHVTVREASPFSVCVGRSPRTGGARNARRRLTASNAHRPIAPKRYARVGLVANMAIPPHCPLLPAQDPSFSTRIAGEGSGTAAMTESILNDIENTWCARGYSHARFDPCLRRVELVLDDERAESGE